jgi:hypothetical protein
MLQWRAKLKHFLILSSAGKPIYSRHGDDQLVTNYIGVVQTIISFYQSTHDTLRGFTAGQVRFVVLSKGPLNLVAITRLAESDAQLRSQLEALYMQILSTLTLPSMERMFAARANYDLRRPLQGTETLLSALADGFTRGSPSTLLSALECLKLRKSHRTAINNALLKTRSDSLLYGLIVASGKLVSVVRPKKHSLHPGDLHLIFNMLFEAGSVKAGGGENWIPLCLPGFNNTGYLYMYVSFLNLEDPTEHMQERPRTSDGADDEVAVLLISAEKESFFELRRMRDDLVEVRVVNSQPYGLFGFFSVMFAKSLYTRTEQGCHDAWITGQVLLRCRHALRILDRMMWSGDITVPCHSWIAIDIIPCEAESCIPQRRHDGVDIAFSASDFMFPETLSSRPRRRTLFVVCRLVAPIRSCSPPFFPHTLSFSSALSRKLP